MKDELDMIFSSKDSDIEKIASRYKAVDDKRKEKIYEISKRKYNTLKAGGNENADDGFIVSAEGVERYRRPSLYRYLSAAAAVIVLFGGVFSGVMLSRSNKIQPMNPSSGSEVTETTVEATTSAELFRDDAVVDKLLSNLEMIQRPQYPDAETVDLSDEIYFNRDEYSPEVDKFLNLTKYYYAVKDERLDTMEEVEAVLNDTFIYESRTSYIGRDLSSHEIGYDFKDDSLGNKYIRTFITYNDKVYVQSKCEPYSSYAYGFDGLYNFSNYKLISSDFTEGGALLYMDRIMYDENYDPVQMDKLVTCTREYEKPDGKKIVAEIELLPEDGIWKIASFTVTMKDEDDQALFKGDTVYPSLEKTSDDGDFAELQLHEQKKYTVSEETSDLIAELDNAWNNGTYQFRKVDTEKYAQQIWNAASYDELNTLENKSFIYHMMWNSYNYFDSADVTYSTHGEDGSNVWGSEGHCFADNIGKYFRVETEVNNALNNETNITYLYDGKFTSANENEKTYQEWTSEYFDYFDRYMPDKYRWIKVYDEAGELVRLQYYYNSDLGVISPDVLYFNAGDFNDFDMWYIEGVEEILGRQCAAISKTEGSSVLEMLIDMRTGIIMRFTNDFTDVGEVHTMKVTNLVLNESVEHKHFDPAGYTKRFDGEDGSGN